MRKAGGAALLIMAWLSAHDGALGEVRSVELRTPRAFGYFAGDSVRLEAIVVTNGDTRLNLASLPHPRALRPWLDLRAVAFEEEKAASGEKRYRLRFGEAKNDANKVQEKPTIFQLPAGEISSLVNRPHSNHFSANSVWLAVRIVAPALVSQQSNRISLQLTA